MMRKILLNKSTSKVSVNNTNGIPIELNRDTSLFHNEITSDTIDTMQVYNDDKDKSNKHRFIFTINPICTNVIFNKLTEIIYKEGSSDKSYHGGQQASGQTFGGKKCKGICCLLSEDMEGADI